MCQLAFNPIAHRVRRKRQRLRPVMKMILSNRRIEDFRSTPTVCPEAFPIKASVLSYRSPGLGFARKFICIVGCSIAIGNLPFPILENKGMGSETVVVPS